MAPLRQQRLMGGATSHITAQRHGSECAAMVALPSGNNAEATALSALKMKLPRQLDRSLVGFRPAGSEENTSAVAHAGRRHGQQALGKSFRRRGMKLRGVGKGKLCRLFGHSLAHRGNAVTDADYSRLPG